MKHICTLIFFIVFLIIGIMLFCQNKNVRETQNNPKIIEMIIYDKDGIKVRSLNVDRSYTVVIAEKGDKIDMEVK